MFGTVICDGVVAFRPDIFSLEDKLMLNLPESTKCTSNIQGGVFVRGAEERIEVYVRYLLERK
jgi:hypothetical protein